MIVHPSLKTPEALSEAIARLDDVVISSFFYRLYQMNLLHLYRAESQYMEKHKRDILIGTTGTDKEHFQHIQGYLSLKEMINLYFFRIEEMKELVASAASEINPEAKRKYTLGDLIRENKRLREEARHWKSNHNAMVARCSMLRDRHDLPIDRIPAYKELIRLQTFLGLSGEDTENKSITFPIQYP